MTVQGSLIREWTTLAIGAPVFGLFPVSRNSFIEQLAKLPDRKGMREADQQTDNSGFDVLTGRRAYGHEYVVVVTDIQAKADNRVKLAGGSVSVDDENQDQELDDQRQGHPIEPVHECEAMEGHVKVFQLHEQAAGMGHIQQHQAHGSVEDCFFALEVGDYLVHVLLVEV